MRLQECLNVIQRPLPGMRSNTITFIILNMCICYICSSVLMFMKGHSSDPFIFNWLATI